MFKTSRLAEAGGMLSGGNSAAAVDAESCDPPLVAQPIRAIISNVVFLSLDLRIDFDADRLRPLSIRRFARINSSALTTVRSLYTIEYA
jgi:hypothetical protein